MRRGEIRKGLGLPCNSFSYFRSDDIILVFVRECMKQRVWEDRNFRLPQFFPLYPSHLLFSSVGLHLVPKSPQVSPTPGEEERKEE